MPIEIDKPSANLLLKDIGTITGDDALALASLYAGVRVKVDGNYIQVIDSLDFVTKWTNISHDMPAVLLQFLIARGFAIPLWFGIDHWANGQTAIQLNLAIAKTN